MEGSDHESLVTLPSGSEDNEDNDGVTSLKLSPDDDLHHDDGHPGRANGGGDEPDDRSESECELPSLLDDSALDAESDTDLPTCCKLKCTTFAESEEGKAISLSITGKSKHEKVKNVYKLIQERVKNGAHIINGKKFCFKGFAQMCQTAKCVIDRLTKHAKDGNEDPPPDGRFWVQRRKAKRSLDVDAFLQWAYTSYAEHLPGGVDKGEATVSMDFPDLNLGKDDKQDKHMTVTELMVEDIGDEVAVSTEERYLRHMTRGQFYDIYKAHGGEASKASFDRVWSSTSWKQKLVIRRIHQHNTCNECI